MTGKANFGPKTIWTGDNLQIMRGMNSDSVDLIYLDPPFNSNANYGNPIGDANFKDVWTLDDINVEEHGELADRNPAAYQIILAAGLTEGKGTQAYLIFMAVRLLEMERILRPTGQIFLHCDDIASGWLTQLMKAIFGKAAYQNTITWQRSPGMNSGKNKVFQRNSDHILHFAGAEAEMAPHHGAHDPEYVEKYYRHDDGDGRGRYRLSDLRAPTFNPPLQFEWKGYAHPPNGWCGNRAHMRKLHEEGRLNYPTDKDGNPAYHRQITQKRYLSESKGVKMGNAWTDIRMLSGKAAEATGYPTQKPLALLERIIEAASNPGDTVFDPFCGCATTMVAADRLQRNWAGIDLSPAAVDLVISRIEEDQGMFRKIKNPEGAPKRSDIKKLPNYRTHAHTLFGLQEGACKGCGHKFPFEAMTVDHDIPRSQGGSDEIGNLSSMCFACNASKGDKTMAEWTAWKKKKRTARWELEQERLKELGI